MPVRRVLIVGNAVLVAVAVTALLLTTAFEGGGSSPSNAGLRALPTPTPSPASAVPRPTATPTAPVVGEVAPAVVDSAPPVLPAAPPAQDDQPAEPETREWLDIDFGAQVLALVNEERAANGASALTANGALMLSAESHAHTLTELNALEHAAGGSDLLSRVQAAGFTDNVQLGEVLWRGGGTFSPQTPVAGWLSSATHREIILNPAYREAGIGCYFREGGPVREARCVLVVAA